MEIGTRLLQRSQQDAAALQQIIQYLEEKEQASGEDHIPSQTNNNHVEQFYEAELEELSDSSETCSELFATPKVTHRYTFCHPGDTRHNKAQSEDVEAHEATPRMVQELLCEDTPCIDEDEFLDLSAYRSKTPYVRRWYNVFLSVDNEYYYFWSKFNGKLLFAFPYYYAMFPEMEDDEHWHFPGFFNEDQDKIYHYGLAEPVMHVGEPGHLLKRNEIFKRVKVSYQAKYERYIVDEDEPVEHFVGTETSRTRIIVT